MREPIPASQNVRFVQNRLRNFKPDERNVEELENISSDLAHVGYSNIPHIKSCIDRIIDCVITLKDPHNTPKMMSDAPPDLNKAYEEACAAADELWNLVREEETKSSVA